MFDVVFNRFDHNDRIHHEGSDQRDRYCQQRNQCGTPPLQEDEYDDNHQDHRFD